MADLDRLVADDAERDANDEDVGAQVVTEFLLDLIPVDDGAGGNGELVVGSVLDGELFVGGGEESGRQERE